MSHVHQYITMSVIPLPIFIYQRRVEFTIEYLLTQQHSTMRLQRWVKHCYSSTQTPPRSDSTRTVLTTCLIHIHTVRLWVHLTQICQKQASILHQTQNKEIKHNILLQECAVYFRTIKRLCIMRSFKHIYPAIVGEHKKRKIKGIKNCSFCCNQMLRSDSMTHHSIMFCSKLFTYWCSVTTTSKHVKIWPHLYRFVVVAHSSDTIG